MKIEGNLGKALILPAATLAAVFAPETLLYAAGMYVAGSLSGAYLEAAAANAADRIRRDYEDSDGAADLLEGLGHVANGFVRTASMFSPIPVLPMAAAVTGHAINKRTFKKPIINDEAVMHGFK